MKPVSKICQHCGQDWRKTKLYEPEPEPDPEPEPESEPEPEPGDLLNTDNDRGWTLNYKGREDFVKVNVENLLSTDVMCCRSHIQNIDFSTTDYLECSYINSETNIKCIHSIAKKIPGTTFFLSQHRC